MPLGPPPVSGDHLHPAVGRYPGNGAASDLDHEHRAVGEGDRALRKPEAGGHHGDVGHAPVSSPGAGAGAVGRGATRSIPSAPPSSRSAASGSVTLMASIPRPGRGLEVRTDVVEERRLSRKDPERFAGQLVDAWIGLAKPGAAGLDERVEVTPERFAFIVPSPP